MPITGADRQTLHDASAGGAEILPFPGRFRPGADALARDASAWEADGAARLDRALLALNQAVSEQQEAVRAWRQTLGTLAGSVRALAGNFDVLDAGLAAASSGLKPSMGE